MDKGIIVALIIGAGIIAGTVLFTGGSDSGGSAGASSGGDAVVPREGENVSIVDGTQIIVLGAKGGYTPERSVAQAGIPSIIRITTKGTFDCSASVRIPSRDVSKLLPASGSTDIDIGTPEPGMLEGSCGMGMYPFEIEFR